MGQTAMRVLVHGEVQGVGYREATVRRAREFGVRGWVRNEAQGTVRLHVEGPPEQLERLLDFLREGPPSARVAAVEVEPVKVEGHEQFAIRGVSAGRFVIHERVAPVRGFDLLLEVDGMMRSWALPRGPSLDPAVKRLAVEGADRTLSDGRAADDDALEDGGAIVWDRGTYEQGGRVAWPQALARGHAVFVLHGHKLRGGFALQRTRPGARPQWLLIKRRDEEARPGSDVVAQQPQSVVSGRTLDEVVG